MRSAVRERMPRRSSAATIITVPRSDDDLTIAPEAIGASRSGRCAPGVRSPTPRNDCAKSWDCVANRRHTVVATSQALDAAEPMFWLMRRRLRSSLREITVGAANTSPVWRRPPTSGADARFFRTCFDVPTRPESERPEKNSRPMCSVLATRVPKTRYVHYSWLCSCSTSHILNAWSLPHRPEIASAMSAMFLSGADDEHRDEWVRKSDPREDS